MHRRLRHRRIITILRRLAIASFFLLAYSSRSSFIIHLQNTFNVPTTSEYRGGLIDDVQSIRCYRWFGQCRSLIAKQRSSDDRIVSWSRISKNLTDESLYSIETSFFYKTYLYVHEWDGSVNPGPISELAISRDSSMIPIQVTQDVQRLIKISDSSVFHNHVHRERRPIIDFFTRDHSDSDIIHSLGEDWKYKGGGIWCKHRSDQDPITNIQLYLGSGFLESRPNWKEVIHEYSRNKGHKSQLISVTREINNGQEKREQSVIIKDDDVLRISLSPHYGKSLKILQISDIHFRCSEDTIAVLSEFQTKHFISNVISRERPDLVVVTGDFLDGDNSLDYQACIMKLVQPMIKSKTPYAITTGVSDYSRFAAISQIQDFIKGLPYSLNRYASPEGHLAISSHFSKGTDAAIYILDSFHPVKQFFSMQKDYQTYRYALAFRHLPIPEYRPEGVFPIIGQYNEQSIVKSKLFDDKILQKIMYSFNVKAMSCGHEHSNDCCLQSRGDMWLCYGGSAGIGIDRMNGMEPSVRLFNIDGHLDEVTSWKRNFRLIESVYDYQYIYQGQL